MNSTYAFPPSYDEITSNSARQGPSPLEPVHYRDNIELQTRNPAPSRTTNNNRQIDLEMGLPTITSPAAERPRRRREEVWYFDPVPERISGLGYLVVILLILAIFLIPNLKQLELRRDEEQRQKEKSWWEFIDNKWPDRESQ
jgi:hypothetical protein